MSVVLRLRSPSSDADGSEDREDRTFAGDGERILRAGLAQLDEFATLPPSEEWDEETQRTVIVSEDRWTAAMLLYSASGEGGWTMYVAIEADAAWTVEGARRLAELLPDLDDVASAIRRRFAKGERPAH